MMQKTRYTVKVDDCKLDIAAFGSMSAACTAMQKLLGLPSHADRVTVIGANGHRVTYIDVCAKEPGFIQYAKKAS
jgi:hypothetical protein